MSIYQAWGKRALDLTLAALLLPLIAPVILVIWGVVRLEGAPGIFAHKRIGRHGREFYCFKIRTMVPDAEIKLAQYLKTNTSAAAEWAETQKLKDDPRTTRLGRFLRKTSLDELPQIWNVMRGDMSFVGPRPITASELDRYGTSRYSYLAMRPGITGIWQVNGRQAGDYSQRVKMDQQYACRQNMLLDLYLIIMTGLVVLKPTGE